MFGDLVWRLQTCFITCGGCIHGVQESASVLLRQWEPLVLQWPLMGPAARQDLISKLASTELIFFLAVKDRTTYEEVC